MPLNIGNSVTVGEICLSCGRYLALECPYGNHTKQSTLEFKGNIANLCEYYMPVDEDDDFVSMGNSKNMQKLATGMTSEELNIALFRQVRALKERDQKKLFKYWDNIFPSEYATDLVTDDNESKQKNKKVKKRDPGKFRDDFKQKEKKK